MAEIEVDVVLALADRAVVRHVVLEAGATAAEAVAAANLGEEGAWVDFQRLGVFGRRVPPDYGLHNGDRVEVYRPLVLDPMEARRRRAGNS